MTTVIGMICVDGIVMGSDTKTTGGDIKYSENKIEEFTLGKSPLIVGEAGSVRHCRDAISWMELANLKEELGVDQTFNNFLSHSVEGLLPQFARDYVLKYGSDPEIEMIIACIDEDKKPRLIQIYPEAEYDHIESYAAVGSGHIFGEVLLRKLYYKDIKVEQAEKLIAYLVWEIQEVDDNSGEDMQLISIDCNGKKRDVPRLQIETYKQLPKLISNSYESLGKEIESVNLKPIKSAIAQLQTAVENFTKSKGGTSHGKANKGTTA
jgi:20S proteasome alpha/beta subunit